MSKIYGIDLGTTNSLLGLNGELFTGLVPSVVDLKTGKAGASQVENMEAKRSFKVDISLFKEGEESVAASARVLRQLVDESGQQVKDVVISVPAYFTDNQRQATRKAAEIAGLNVVTLINEPTAAAIYASRDRRSLSVIFDLGGGTFDVSVVDSRLSDYDVQATDGCILGGDNFDAALRNHIIKHAGIKIHHYFPADLKRLQWRCSLAKIQLQETMDDVEIDLTDFEAGHFTLTPDVYQQIMKTIFAPAILKAKTVLADAVPAGEPYDLIMVGGSTRCPYLRAWVARELKHEPMPLFYDPDRIVALGATIYAQMVADGTAEIKVSDVTKALSISLHNGTSHVIIPRNSKIPVEETTIVVNPVETDELTVRLWQGDSFLAKDNEFIGSLVYNYGKVVPPGEGEVIVGLRVDSDGSIHFSCREVLGKPVEVVLQRVNR